MVKKTVIRIFLGFLSFIIILTIGVVAFIKTSPQFGASPAGADLERIMKSANYQDNQFVNLITTKMDLSFSSGAGVMYKLLFESAGRSPEKALPVKFGENGNLDLNNSARITWYGHSAVLLELDGKKILIDPMLGKAASPVPFFSKRFAYEKHLNEVVVEQIDAVLLSHDHYDHLDYPTIVKIKEEVGHFYTPLGVGSHLASWGVDPAKITELDWWQSAELAGLSLTAAPARHFSGRGLTDRNKTQWASWVVQGENERIYFSGDSGYGPHFKEIGERFGPFDFAMMECGQYNERWEAIHMMPEQTIQASLDIHAKRMMPIHWSAFDLSLHSWTEPVDRALQAAKGKDVVVITPFIGQTFVPADAEYNHYWWRNY